MNHHEYIKNYKFFIEQLKENFEILKNKDLVDNNNVDVFFGTNRFGDFNSFYCLRTDINEILSNLENYSGEKTLSVHLVEKIDSIENFKSFAKDVIEQDLHLNKLENSIYFRDTEYIDWSIYVCPCHDSDNIREINEEIGFYLATFVGTNKVYKKSTKPEINLTFVN